MTKTVAARNAGPNSPNNANSTLNRPMASQSGTRYEDRTMKRSVPGPRGPAFRVSAVDFIFNRLLHCWIISRMMYRWQIWRIQKTHR